MKISFEYAEQRPFYCFSINRMVLEKLTLSEESGFAKRQFAAHWSRKQSPFKREKLRCKIIA